MQVCRGRKWEEIEVGWEDRRKNVKERSRKGERVTGAEKRRDEKREGAGLFIPCRVEQIGMVGESYESTLTLGGLARMRRGPLLT